MQIWRWSSQIETGRPAGLPVKPVLMRSEEETTMIKIRITINGTTENRYTTLWGLKQNPFPRIAIHEWAWLDNRLNSLDGIPVTSEMDIVNRLKGCPEGFIKYIVSCYKPGERVEINLLFDDELGVLGIPK
jgi:hypothetical protein